MVYPEHHNFTIKSTNVAILLCLVPFIQAYENNIAVSLGKLTLLFALFETAAAVSGRMIAHGVICSFNTSVKC